MDRMLDLCIIHGAPRDADSERCEDYDMGDDECAFAMVCWPEEEGGSVYLKTNE